MQRDSNDWRSYQVSGIELMDVQPKKARAYFEWAARLDPARPEPWYALALLTDKDEPLREALQRDPFMHMGKIRTFRVEGDDPRQVFGLRNLGWYDLAAGQPDSARVHFQMAMQRWPDDESVLWGLALAYRDTGFPDSAEHAIARQRDRLRAKAASKSSLTVLSLPFFEYMIGRSYAHAKRIDEARLAYERALAEDLSYHPAHVGLAVLAMSIGDTAQALSEWDLSISLVPEDASYRVAYAVLLSAVGRHADARSHAGAAVESAPAYAVARRVLAEALDTLGEAGAARDAYREYIARAPQVESKAIALALERIEALPR
jgi:tetratricopeptide (TPR) repeat protein